MAKAAAGFKPFYYAALALPLAFAGLPLYVHLPQYYAIVHNVSLGALGFVLLFVRLIDTVQDPIIGWLSDKYPHRKRWIVIAMPFLAITFLMLFHYPDGSGISPALWLGGCLFFTYTSFSVIQINYYALGAEYGKSEAEHTRIAAWREGVMLGGILFAAILPDMLGRAYGQQDGFGYFSWAFAVMLAVGGYIALQMNKAEPKVKKNQQGFFHSLKKLMAIKRARWLLLFFFFNTLAMATTSTLYLFFITDVISAPQHAGQLLGLYFLMGALGMPFWAFLAKKISREKAMLGALILAIICFIGAFNLGAGDVKGFYLVAFLTGASLGADMALPVAMMAELLHEEKQSTSFGFGLWNFISKGNLALAAGITLPLIGATGYMPGGGNGPHELFALRAGYALFPCAIKVVGCLILWYGFIKQGRKE